MSRHRTDIRVKEVKEHKLIQLQVQMLNGIYLVNCRCWTVGTEKETKAVVGNKQDERWRTGGDGGSSEENCGRKYGCHAKARAGDNRGKEGGRKEGWRVEMMDVLLSFRAP